MSLSNSLIPIPTEQSYGNFGGQFIAETLVGPLSEVANQFFAMMDNPKFREEIRNELKDFVGRPTALTNLPRLSRHIGGAELILKREDLNHTGAHKINNCLGQMILAKKMGKKRIIAETGAGQHGVATATMAARLGLECHVYMGKVDAQRQQLNVFRMKVLGAEVHEVDQGTATLKDAINEALRAYVADPEDSYYLIGSALGPYPYPQMVRKFQSVIGEEARTQFLERYKKLPDYAIACVGGGSNAIGLFSAFLDDPVNLVGIEAGGKGLDTHQHAARIPNAQVGFFQGSKTLVLQDHEGQIQPTHSIAAGLDYTAVGPEHAQLFEEGRVQYETATDEETLEAFHLLSRFEGILPALESAHAVAGAIRIAQKLKSTNRILINLSGRGDKDLPQLFSEAQNDF